MRMPTPKHRGTRKQRAQSLLRILEAGPHFSVFDLGYNHDPELPQVIKRGYDLWANSWIISELKSLVPELREGKK